MAVTPIQPRALAQHALAVARDAGSGGPHRDIWLRRSTSASYYAVFHAVASAVAEHLAPLSEHDEGRRLTRSVQHTKVKEVCQWLTGRGEGRDQVQPIVRRLRANPGLVAFASTFNELQEARHAADYDHLAAVDLTATVEHHSEAVRALDLLDAVRRTPDGGEFLALIALHTNLR